MDKLCKTYILSKTSYGTTVVNTKHDTNSILQECLKTTLLMTRQLQRYAKQCIKWPLLLICNMAVCSTLRKYTIDYLIYYAQFKGGRR